MTAQGGRRHFPKYATIDHSKPSEFRKPVASGDGGNACGCWVSLLQRCADEVKPTQSSVAAGAHAEELATTHPQCPFPHFDGGADLGHGERSVVVRCQDSFETGHDLGVASIRDRVVLGVVCSQTVDQGMEQILL